MISVTDKKSCCGCNACGDICPKKCIFFDFDTEGFLYPHVNIEDCINCHLCEKVCPVIQVDALKHNDYEKSICYAAENKNMQIVFDSTSGGLFSAFADTIYEKGGYVGGAIYNEDFSISHFISNDKNDLPRLRSSKYAQSNALGFYKKVKDLCASGKNVLVCGTPCQMVALRAFLGKDYPNLIILDFICRGINSPKVWRKYLDSFEERYGSPVVYVKAKSKEYGWHNLTYKVKLANDKIYYEPVTISKFMQGFLQTNVYCRPSCYDCKFKGFPRTADITIADFWGIEKINSSFSNSKDTGTSLVMINSKKGQSFFYTIKENIHYIPVDFPSAVKGNPSLFTPLQPEKVDRKKFFEDLNSFGFLSVADKYITFKISLKTRIKKFILFAFTVLKTTRLHPSAVYQTVRYSGIRKLIQGKGIVFAPHCCLNISKSAKLDINGCVLFGMKSHFPKSKLETRLWIGDNAIFKVEGDANIHYGADIELFPNSKFILKGRRYGMSYFNISSTIICAYHITIGYDVILGRNVTIRDTNGNHFINTPHYENSVPVKIGDKVWLCENVSIMPGSIVGSGCIIGASSMVRDTIPDSCMAVGIPAKVIRKNILWKA